MKPPLLVRSLSAAERDSLTDSLRSRDAFALRRAQILLARSEGQSIAQIAKALHTAAQTVRMAIHAFNNEGIASLTRKSNRPKTVRCLLGKAEREWLAETINKSPRLFAKETSLWTTTLLATVAFEQGITPFAVDEETVRRALIRLGINWKRAKKRIISPDIAYTRKKSVAIA